MKEALTRQDTLPLARTIAAALEAANETITALDAQIGDGDLGVTCRLGMAAAVAALEGLPDASLDEQLLQAGITFNSAGASTFGALVASAAMRAARYAKERGLQAWDLASLAEAGEAAAEGIHQRGKAARGDKTLLDALWPAVEALQRAAEQGKSLCEGLQDAAAAAAEGAEATRPLQSRFGRAAWMQERTVGVQDPGSAVVAIVIGTVADYVAQS